MFGACDVDERAAVADDRMIPEEIALERGFAGARRDDASDADLGLGAEAHVADQRAGIVAAPDGVVAGCELLEAEQRLPCILRAGSEREGEIRDRPVFAIGAVADDGRIRSAVEPAWGD